MCIYIAEIQNQTDIKEHQRQKIANNLTLWKATHILEQNIN